MPLLAEAVLFQGHAWRGLNYLVACKCRRGLQYLLTASAGLSSLCRFVGEMNTSAPAPTYIDCVQ